MSNIGVFPLGLEDIKFIDEVVKRLGIVSLHYKQAGKELKPTAAVQKAMGQFDDFRKRLRRDIKMNIPLQASRSDIEAAKIIARWLVDSHHQLKGTEAPASDIWVNPGI